MSTKSLVLLYGLPCSGKSSVLRALPGHARVAVDAIITTLTPDPSIADFQRLGDEIVGRLASTLQGMEETKVVIEMGCLIPMDATRRLESIMAESGMNYTNILLIADDDELIRRIERRNAAIEAGESESIRVDGPDYLSRFKRVFNLNLPDSYVTIDTTDLSPNDVVERLNHLQGKKGSHP